MVCTLSPDELSVRGQRWQRLRDRAAVEVVTIDAGLRLRFAAGPGIEQELRELAGLERECCSFAEWNVAAGGGAVWLDVTTKGDDVAAVQSMFASFR